MTTVHGAARKLTAAARSELGLSPARHPPYRWAFASLVVGTACVPLLMAKMWTTCFLVTATGLVVLPFFRWFENRDAAWRDEVFRFGRESTGRVLDIEPAAPGRADHIVRVEFRAGDQVVRASVIGCPLAGRGLMPEDRVVVLYAPERPTRCLVVRKVTMEIVDAIFED